MSNGLWERLIHAAKKLIGLRRPVVRDVFERRLYLWPQDLRVEELGGRVPYAAFNPGALLERDELLVFPRLVTGYFWYTSVIGFMRLRLSDVLEARVEKPLSVRIVVHPSTRRDLAGCEDPRASRVGDKYYVLYTALEPYRDRLHAINAYSAQGVAILGRGLGLEKKLVLDIADENGNRYRVDEVKDSALLSEEGNRFWILTRPVIEGVAASWRGLLDLGEGVIRAESLEPVLLPEPWEYKTGWSTNAVRLGSDEYLVAWHGVGRDLVYRTGFAVVDHEGSLRALTNYLLEPRTVQEFSGERPGVIFGCGLVRHGELLLYIGGVADTGIGVYVAEIDRVMENMIWLQKA